MKDSLLESPEDLSRALVVVLQLVERADRAVFAHKIEVLRSAIYVSEKPCTKLPSTRTVSRCRTRSSPVVIGERANGMRA